ncbi:hypothetical protein MRX96_042977 [Rhipicephalus microplus]
MRFGEAVRLHQGHQSPRGRGGDVRASPLALSLAAPRRAPPKRRVISSRCSLGTCDHQEQRPRNDHNANSPRNGEGISLCSPPRTMPFSLHHSVFRLRCRRQTAALLLSGGLCMHFDVAPVTPSRRPGTLLSHLTLTEVVRRHFPLHRDASEKATSRSMESRLL